jgi:putative membrane protein
VTQPVADTRLHPLTLITRTLRALPQAAGGVAFYAVAARDLGRLLVLVPAALAIAGAIAFLVWSRFRYGIGEREIVIEQGVFSRQRRVIPFERVQDIAIEQKLLARLLGLALVKIETGSSGADEGQLDSVGLEDAHRLRDIVRGAKAGLADAEIPAEAAPEPLLFEMGVGRVLFSGLFQFSLVFIAAIGAILQNLDEWGIRPPPELRSTLEATTARNWILFTLAVGALLVLAGFLAGVLRTLARDYGFRLTRAANGLRRRRGLFTLSETVIPIRRMQVARIESGLVARALGWHGLAFQTLGADRKERGAQTAAPFARIEEIEPILAETGFPAPATIGDWHRSPRRSILRRGLGPAVLALPIFAIALLWEPRAALAGAVATLAAALLAARWTRHYHAEGETALFVTDGLLKRRMKVMPWGRIQAISVVAGPLQRRLRLATVAVDTAGAPSGRSLAIVDLERSEAEALAERLLARFAAARRADRLAGTVRPAA